MRPPSGLFTRDTTALPLLLLRDENGCGFVHTPRGWPTGRACPSRRCG